jgi:GTP pyrophosphokinase
VNDLDRAIEIALDAHEDQTDKAGATYIRHPLRLMQQMETEQTRISAVLHDVVEDSDYSLSDIENKFNTEIRNAVDSLTKRDGESYIEFIDRASEHPVARRVKIADLEDNLDLTRLEELTDDIHAKQRTYHKAWKQLQNDSSVADR